MSGFGEGLGPGGHFSGFLFQLGEFFTALKRSLREGRDESTDQHDTAEMRFFLPCGGAWVRNERAWPWFGWACVRHEKGWAVAGSAGRRTCLLRAMTPISPDEVSCSFSMPGPWIRSATLRDAPPLSAPTASKKRRARSENGPRILYLIMRTRNGKRAQKTDRESCTLSCGQQTGSALRKRTENPLPCTPTALRCSVGLAWYCVLITVQFNAGPMEVK